MPIPFLIFARLSVSKNANILGNFIYENKVVLGLSELLHNRFQTKAIALGMAEEILLQPGECCLINGKCDGDAICRILKARAVTFLNTFDDKRVLDRAERRGYSLYCRTRFDNSLCWQPGIVRKLSKIPILNILEYPLHLVLFFIHNLLYIYTQDGRVTCVLLRGVPEEVSVAETYNELIVYEKMLKNPSKDQLVKFSEKGINSGDFLKDIEAEKADCWKKIKKIEPRRFDT